MIVPKVKTNINTPDLLKVNSINTKYKIAKLQIINLQLHILYKKVDISKRQIRKDKDMLTCIGPYPANWVLELVEKYIFAILYKLFSKNIEVGINEINKYIIIFFISKKLIFIPSNAIQVAYSAKRPEK